MHVQVVTSEKTLVDEEVDEIVVPTVTGEIAILPHHVPLVTQIAPGELILKSHGKNESFAIVGGFLEVSGKNVSILADYAVHGNDVSVVNAEEARARAEKAMKEHKSGEDFALAQGEFLKAIAELKVAKRLKHTSTLPK